MLGAMIRRLVLLVATISTIAIQPTLVLAHGGGEPLIHVPLDHIEPGQSFPLLAADLGENAHVTFEIRFGDVATPLGAAVAGADGHFETTLTLPSSYPAGYAQLVAESDDGSVAEVWVRVGTTSDAGAPPSSLEHIDLVPFVALLAAVLALVMLVVRTRPRPPRDSHR
jgi:hypothetical protein